MPKREFYDTVIKNGYDVGSGALAVVDEDIEMRLNEYGEYISASKNDKTNVFDNPKLALVSAMSDKSPNETMVAERLYAQTPGIKHDTILGYYTDLYAGYVVEGDYRKKASSGGLTTWLLKELLRRKLIDGVIHVKEAHDGDGVLFKYAISSTIEEIRAGAKSKYYPAEFSEAMKTIRRNKGKYAIVGIPSIIMEVRLLALQDSLIAERIAFTIGLICGHQKSTKYAENLAWQCGIRPGDLEHIDFRKKTKGRAASDYDTELIGIVAGKRQKITKRTNELFASNWGHGMFKVKFSDFTDDTMNETADIALGDAWLPEYSSDWRGTNVLIVRNDTISRIIKEGAKDRLVTIKHLTPSDVIKSQSGLVHHTRDELPHRLYGNDRHGMWRPAKRFTASNNLSFSRKQVQNLRSKTSTQSRIAHLESTRQNDWSYFEKRMSPYVRLYNFVYLLIHLKGKTPRWVFEKIIAKFRN